MDLDTVLQYEIPYAHALAVHFPLVLLLLAGGEGERADALLPPLIGENEIDRILRIREAVAERVVRPRLLAHLRIAQLPAHERRRPQAEEPAFGAASAATPSGRSEPLFLPPRSRSPMELPANTKLPSVLGARVLAERNGGATADYVLVHETDGTTADGSTIWSGKFVDQRTGAYPFNLNRGDQIFRDANVFTEEFGSVHMLFDDGTDMTLGPSTDVTIDEVMALTQRVFGYEHERTRTGYIVMPARLEARVFHVDYPNLRREGVAQTRISSGDAMRDVNAMGVADSGPTPGSVVNTVGATDFWVEIDTALKSLVGDAEGRSVVLSPQSNLVVVRGLPSELREVESYLSQVQGNMVRQVIMEAKVLEVVLSDEFQAGINWAALAQPTRASSSGISSIPPGRSSAPGRSSTTVTSRFTARPTAWQRSQSIAACAPMSGNDVRRCSSGARASRK